MAKAKARLRRGKYQGETVMREWLNLLVDSDNYEDDAAPGFLANPATGGRLELDRFYPPSVGLEVNGPQHYGLTGDFTQEDVDKQRARDLTKRGLCVELGIELVVVHAADLSLENMRQKVGNLLPLRDLVGYERLINYLEFVSRRYRNKAAQGA